MATAFGGIDYAVFLGTLVISLSIGVFFAVKDKRKKRNSPDDYFLAGRNSSTFPVVLSFVVTFQSSLLILASPVEVYAYGMLHGFYTVGLVLSYIFAGLIIVPVLFPLKITSINKYFQLRYRDNLVRYLVLFTGVVYSIFYMGAVIFGTCVAAEVVIGIPYWVTVLIYSIVTTIYTSIGGIKAVIWTDVFQLLIMTFGIVAVLVMSIIDTGGVSKVVEIAHERLDVGEMSFDPTIRYTVWNVSIGSFTMFLYVCVSQSGIQRVNSTPTLRSARLVYILAAPVYAIVMLMTCYEGVTVFAYHASKGCDVLEGGVVDNINEIMPLTVIKLFKNMPGIKGLFIASLSSAVLSTLSSCLSSLSAVTYEDVIREKYPNMDDKKATLLSKFTVLGYGLTGMAITFVIAKLPGSIVNIFQGFMACVDGPTSAVFVLSVFCRRATSKGVFLGALCGMAVSFWLIMGKTLAPIPEDEKLPPGPTDMCWQYANISETTFNFTRNFETTLFRNTTIVSTVEDPSGRREFTIVENLYRISYILYSLIGFIITIVTSLALSCCTKPPKSVGEKYLFSFSKHIMKDLFGKGCSESSNRKTREEVEEASSPETKDLLAEK